MKFGKYNDYSNVATTVVSGGSSSTFATINRTIWGNEDTGGNINDNIFLNGSIYISQNDYDEDGEDTDDIDRDREYNTRSDDNGGNIYMENGYAYTYGVQYNYSGGKKDLETHQGEQDSRLKYLESLFPVGSILMYAGNISIPTGWHICDGTAGTVDLRKRFIRCANSTSTVGNKGGNETISLNVNQLPEHNHSARTTINLSKSTTLNPAFDNVKDQIIVTQKETYYQAFDMGGDKHYTCETGYEAPQDKGIVEITVGDMVGYVADVNYTATATTTIDPEGDSEAFSILPPFYDLIFIQRIS